MSDNAQQKVKMFFEQPEVRATLDEIAQKYFKNENRRIFLYYFDLVKIGQNNIDDILKFLINKIKLDVNVALAVNDELFDKIFADAYYYLVDFYEQVQRQRIAKYIESKQTKELKAHLNLPPDKQMGSKDQKITLSKVSEEMKLSELEKKYKEFIRSSFYQNAKQAEDDMEKRLIADSKEFKNLFYSAINAGDRVKATGAFFAIFKNGVKKFFTNDSRFEDFLNDFLSKKDSTEAENFSKNKTAEKYIVLFVRLILEKKLKLAEQESALVGIVLGSLAKQAGDQEFSDIAYGDETNNKFMWENL
ncbi:MAG: hypothetical protein ABIF17_01675 [Patescibacteria group bacterium]